MAEKKVHVAMFPWFAFGHLTSFIHIANKLAHRGHKISFFLPTMTQQKLEPFNHHPELITFVPIDVPHVDGLPIGSETTADVSFHLQPLIMTAMDLTRPAVEASLGILKPDIVFFDFAHWVPAMSRQLGLRSVHYCTISAATVGYLISPARESIQEARLVGRDLLEPPPGFPESSIKLSGHEAQELAVGTMRDFGSGVSFLERQLTSFRDCDALAFKTCREIEGPYCDYLKVQFGKPVFLAGPVTPEPPICVLEDKWVQWLGKFEPRSVIFCSLGSEYILGKVQFQELVSGLELTDMPFLAALKHPMGEQSTEYSASKGIVTHWVPQNLILRHPSVGCFVTHCGSGSLSEAMTGNCQMVFLPCAGDQFFNARTMAGELRIGVEIERGEDGSFTKDGICEAIRSVIDENGEVGKEVRANYMKWKEFFLRDDLEELYLDEFVGKLISLSG